MRMTIVRWSDLRTMFDPPLIEDAIWSLPLQQNNEVIIIKKTRKQAINDKTEAPWNRKDCAKSRPKTKNAKGQVIIKSAVKSGAGTAEYC
ncbi:hypothetical protein Tco_1549386 [Tanacetum coccineum]